jgi:hypothetical protein
METVGLCYYSSVDIKQALGIVAGIISFSAYLIYIRSILRGESKPNRVTWWIWSFMGAIFAASYWAVGARNTIWAPIVEFIGPLTIAFLTIKYGEGTRKDRTDVICFFGGIVSIMLWIVFKSPVIALVLSIAVDAFAIVPTVKKSWLRPDGENFWAWFTTGMADAMNVFAVERHTFGITLYPAYMVTMDLLIILILLRGKIKAFGKAGKHVKDTE